MATLTGTGLQFPNNDLLTGVIGPNYVARWATTSMGSNNDWLNLEVIMPAAKSANSRYLIIGEANAHTSPNGSTGCGLAFWLELQNGNSYWVNRQGVHEEYGDGSYDPYYVVHNMIIDDGNNSTGNDDSTGTHTGCDTRPVVAGETRKYRMYGRNNNNNVDWGNGVGKQQGWRGYLCVIELDGSICS